MYTTTCFSSNVSSLDICLRSSCYRDRVSSRYTALFTRSRTTGPAGHHGHAEVKGGYFILYLITSLGPAPNRCRIFW